MPTPSSLNLEATNIIRQLTLAYDADILNSDNIYLRLEQDCFHPLVLERHEPNVFSLTHYYTQNGDLMSDPDVTFLIHRHERSLSLYPLSITQSALGIYDEVAFLNDKRDGLKSIKPSPMKDIADFCNVWASNILAQGWFLTDSKPNPEISVRS